MNEGTDLGTELAVDFDGDLPPSVDEAALRRMNVAVRVLDEGVRVPGTDFRVGIDPVLGVVPGGGDLLAGGLSLYVIAEAARQGVPVTTLARMLANLGIDLLGGSLPVVGVVFDAVWKANKRNLALALERLAVDASDGVEPITVDID